MQTLGNLAHRAAEYVPGTQAHMSTEGGPAGPAGPQVSGGSTAGMPQQQSQQPQQQQVSSAQNNTYQVHTLYGCVPAIVESPG